jgi:hypothetical protein
MTKNVNKFTDMIQLRVSTEYLAALDDWRRKQTPIPSRSAAIRAITAKTLKKTIMAT